MNENLDPLRHSTAHLLAAAVKELYPKTKLGIGPSIENGFYYDFDFEKPVSEDDLPKIEEKMAEIVKNWKGFERIEVDKPKAILEFKGNPYKKDLIEEFSKENKTLTFYKSGDFTDLCKGGHVENPDKEIEFFKLLSLAGAYWHGSEKNPMLTRIYGTIWPSKKELEDHLIRLEEAKKNDHRVIGKELGLFVNSDLVGKGLPLLTSKGATIKRTLERFIVDEEIKRGYEHVLTPPLAKIELYEKSGHYPYYKDTMYPVMQVDDEKLILRPMTCPHHFMLYKSELHSYRELPLKLAEISPQFRYEKSGELSGLMRVRTFTLADAHIFVQPDKVKEEIRQVLELIDFANENLGLKKGTDYRYRLSLGDRNDQTKYFKDDDAWEKAEDTLRSVLKETDAPFFEAEGEAAFYGPKIDIQIKNVLGKEETAFTVQYDFVMPKRFNLEYIDEDGKTKQPVVIHRSSIGSLERTMAFLIEHHAGKLPFWLAPIQFEIIPIADRHFEYAKEVLAKIRALGFRAEINAKSEPMGAKIREAQIQKIPYMLILGDREQAQKTMSVRHRDGGDLEIKTIEQIADFVKEQLPKING